MSAVLFVNPKQGNTIGRIGFLEVKLLATPNWY